MQTLMLASPMSEDTRWNVLSMLQPIIVARFAVKSTEEQSWPILASEKRTCQKGRRLSIGVTTVAFFYALAYQGQIVGMIGTPRCNIGGNLKKELD